MSNIIAILCGDLHLSHIPPSARADESDWYAAMQRPLDELWALAEKYDAPIICSGDVFDRWQVPPELLSFALDYLPPMYAVAGQHDLPNHNADEMHRSAYGVMVRTGRIKDLGRHGILLVPQKLQLAGFPWGKALTPFDEPQDEEYGREEDCTRLAVIHQYLWTKKQGGYPGAPEDQRLDKMKDILSGYDAALFGDNHRHLTGYANGCKVINCGTFMRRHSDDRDHCPLVGLLHDEASIETHYLDMSKDVFVDVAETTKPNITEYDFSGFLADLDDLSSDSLDFRRAVEEKLRDIDDDDVRREILSAIGEGD